MVKTILRLEGLAFFLIGITLYLQLEGNIWLFFLFLFAPDISMLGYIKNKRLGAIVYNLVHNYFTAILLFVVGLFSGNSLLGFAGLILFSHVGLDHLFGFGLKYHTNFKDTHLQKV